jgi:predicted RND superfamily exporter protein
VVSSFAQFVTQRAAPVLVALAAITILAIVRLVDFGALMDGRWLEVPRVVIDPSQSSLLPRGDEAKEFYDRVRLIFGNDETLLLAVERDEGIFEPETLDAIRRLTERVEEISQVRSVISIANAPNIRSVDGELIIAPLYSERPADQAEADRIREELFDNPILASNVVTEDARGAIVVVYLLEMSDLDFALAAIDHQILEIAQEEIGNRAHIWLSGSPHIKAETSRLLAGDMATVIPAAFALMVIIAFLSFRTIRGVVVPVFTIGLAIIWMMGFAAVFIPKLNIVTSSVPAILLGIGFAYAIHVLSAYYDAVREGKRAGVDQPRDTAACQAVRHVGVPTLLTGLTTAIGFGSLATSPLAAIREFGILAGVGVFCTMVATLTFAPALLQLLPEKAPPGSSEEPDLIDRLLGRLALFDVRHRRGILVTGAVVAILSLAAIPRIQISTNMAENFPEHTSVRQSIDATSRLLGASDQVYVILETDYAEAFKEPVNLAEIESLQNWLLEQPEVGGVLSLTDHVKLINQGFNDNDPEFFAIPTSKRLVSQLLFFGASDETKRLVNSRYQITSLQVRIGVVNSADVVHFADRVEERLAQLPKHITGRITGSSILIARTSDEIALGQALSLSTALLIIFAILAMLFASVRVGALAMIPNVLPVLVYFGALGWFGITLNMTTGVVACLVLGIAVDDTIHLLARFNALAKERADEATAIREALSQVGRAVTFTSASLVLGFLVIAASTLKQQVEFGMLSAFTLAVAWVVDITFTPALAAGMRIVTLWEVVSLDLGDHPQRAIPLFRGLSAAQAKIAALMTDIVEHPEGHRLFTVGEQGDDMYVVIEGELRSSIEQGGRTVPLTTHTRGDVIGEVGVFKGQRTANTDCAGPVRLLRFDQGDLDQLRRRYPRIGAIFFRNLSEILAHRLVALTERVR